MIITLINPETIDAIAPFSEYPFQNKLNIITGQKVAAIPDQPNIMTQKTCRYGETIAIVMAIPNAMTAIITVTYLDILVS